MVDPSEFERAAMVEGGELGGEYLDYLNKTDLATLTAEEWAMFVESVITGYQESMQRQAAASAALHPDPAPPLDQERAEYIPQPGDAETNMVPGAMPDLSLLPCGGEFCDSIENCSGECPDAAQHAPGALTLPAAQAQGTTETLADAVAPAPKKRTPRLTPIEKAVKRSKR